MKIRKIFMALCGILFVAQTVSAQQYMFVVEDSCIVDVVNVSSVDYATFNANDKWFTMSDIAIESVGSTSITASCTMGLSSGTDVKWIIGSVNTGVCYSKDKTFQTCTYGDGTLWLGGFNSVETFTFTLNNLTTDSTYYLRPFVEYGDAVFYGDVVTVKTRNHKTINGHKFVDLGLPCGVLWAETNVGAETATSVGDYFAWGETSPKESYSWSSYKYGDGASPSMMTKYNRTDGKTTLDKEDDAASVNWGDSCRTPTSDEFTELINTDNCTWTQTIMETGNGEGIKGYKVTSTKNGNSIFFPEPGGRTNNYIRNWTSTIIPSNIGAYMLMVGTKIIISREMRCDGIPVRPVAEP